MEKHSLIGGVDFQDPEGIVEMQWCWFLPGGTDILVNTLCENNNVLQIIGSEEAKPQRTVAVEGEVVVLAIGEDKIAYTVNKNGSPDNTLICYDYVNDISKEIFKTTDSILSAGFSPDSESLIFFTYADCKHKYFIYDIRQ